MEQLVRMAHEAAPKPLGPSQMDPVNGRLNWPSALQQDSFDSQREQLDQLFATRAKYGGLNYADQLAVRKTVDAMFDELKAQIRDIPPQDYAGVSKLSGEPDVRRIEKRTGIENKISS